MRYRNKIRHIERIIKHFDKIGVQTFTNNTLNKGNFTNLKLSDVKNRIFEHYKSNISPNTFRSYISSFNSFIRLIGDKNINMIGKLDLEEYKLKRCKEVNPVSTNIDIRNIKAIFNKIVEYELIECSRLSGVKQIKIKSKKILAIESADIVRILNAAMDEQMNQIIRLTLLTASRISEVLNIKVKDIDFERGILNVYQQKTNCYKTIPLSDRLTELLNEICKSNTEGTDNNLKESYIFYKRSNYNPFLKLRSDTVSKRFKKILRSLDLSEDFSFHSLRHTSITELIRNNVPLNVVKEIAGHKSISTTMIYSHVRSKDMKQAVNLLNY